MTKTKAAPTTDRLADIAEGWRRFEAEVIDAEGVLNETLAAEHEALQLRERHKVDGLALYVQSLDVQAAGLEQMAKAIAAKAKTLRNRQEWLKTYAGNYLTARGLDEVVGDLGFKVKWVGNGGQRPLTLAEDVPPERWPRPCTKLVVDPGAVRQLMEDVPEINQLVDLDGNVLATLHPRGRHVRIG